jgi:hypothetical protein
MVSVSLLEKGYLINDIAEFYNIAECCNTTKPLVAQLAQSEVSPIIIKTIMRIKP